MLSWIDATIIYTFIAIALCIGALSGRSIKSITDYISYYKHFHPTILGLSLVMVMLGGGSTSGTMVEIRFVGIIYALASFGYVINSFITARFIIPKIDYRFQNMLTVCDAMRSFYGNKAALFTGFVAVIFDLGAATSQLSVLGKTISYFIDVPYKIGLLITGGVMVFYSVVGGIRTVTIMDIIKCTLILIFIPVFTSTATYKAGGIVNILNHTPSEYISIFNHPEIFKYSILFIFFMAPVHMLQPVVVQRLFMISDTNIACKSMYMYGLARTGVIWMITSIGLASFVLIPNAPAGHALFIMAYNILPPVLIGFVIISIIAIVMCKADAHLNSIGIITISNLIPQAYKARFGELTIIRSITLLGGLIALLVAVADISVISISVFIESLWSVEVGVPLLAGILRLKFAKQQFYLYLLCTLPFVCFIFWLKISYYTPLLLLVIGILCFWLIQFLYAKYLKQTTITTLVFREIPRFILNNIPSLKTITKYSSHKVEIVGADYFVFGIFFCVNYTVPYFMWDYSHYDTFYFSITLRTISGLMCLILLLKNFWPTVLTKYFPLYWHLTLFITLPFMTVSMLLLQQWSTVWMINVALSIFLLVLLTDWLTFIILAFMGILFAIVLHILLIGAIHYPDDSQTIYLSSYTFFFLIVIGAIFSRRKQKSTDEKLEIANLLGGTIAHEMRTFLLVIKNYSSGLSNHIPLLLNSYKKAVQHQLIDSPLPEQQFSSLRQIILGIDTVLQKSFSFINLLLVNIREPRISEPMQKLNIWDCVDDALQEYPLSDKERGYINIIPSKYFTILGNKEILTHILFNLLSNALYYIAQSDHPQITIWSSDSPHYLYLHFKDNGCGIKKDDIDLIFKRFYTNRKKGSGLGLFFCKVSMKMLGGDIICNSVEGEYTEFILQFPQK